MEKGTKAQRHNGATAQWQDGMKADILVAGCRVHVAG
jgi:hypothetical protein